MKKTNRTCICCSEKYSYCNTCSSDIGKPVWMNIYHNDNCRILFNTASDYYAGEITKEQAKEQFESCDLSYKKKLHYSIVNAINEVCKIEAEDENVKSLIKTEIDSNIEDITKERYAFNGNNKNKKNKKNLDSDLK